MNEKLLVEKDDSTLQETLTYILKRQGYEVETTDDGISSIDWICKMFPRNIRV